MFLRSNASAGVKNLPIIIRRTEPEPGPTEEPHLTSQGYKLVDPKNKPRNLAKFQVYVKTLEEVVRLIEDKGFGLWMKQPGKAATLILADKLIIRRL
jgi:hypothetical protein